MTFCGILNLDKPVGMTSREVVDRVVKLVRPAKAGHAGTLDPLATGVLLVCVGHATRLIGIAQEGRKRYLARFVLGQQSDTDDITGKVTKGGEWSHVTRNQLAAILPEFMGCIQQVPPQFSAVHVKGERAYALARAGITVELAARLVEVHTLEVTHFDPPEFDLAIECGSGTYVRSIGRDLGRRIGCGVVMSQLRRTAVGPFEVTSAISPDALTRESIGVLLQPAADVVSHLPRRELTDEELISIRRGQAILCLPSSVETAAADREIGAIFETRTAMFDRHGHLVGIAEIDTNAPRLQPRIVFPETVIA